MSTTTPAVTNGNGAMSPFATKQLDLWRLAANLAQSDLVPQHFRNKPANVFLALQMADRMNLDLFAVMSNLYVVHGTPAFSSKFLIGLANTCGAFKGSLRFKFTGEGETAAATCEATLRETGDVVAVTVTMAQAKAAGWTADKKRKDGGTEPSKYRIMGSQMLAYRAAAFFVRLYCPESTFGGARTVDEVEDMHASGALEPRDAEVVQRQDPLSRELNTEGAQRPRDGSERVTEGEGGARVADGGAAPSPHAKAIAAFAALGVPAAAIEAEIAQLDPVGVADHLRALYKIAKADGARALVTRLRSESAADMLDSALDSEPESPMDTLFGATEAHHED